MNLFPESTPRMPFGSVYRLFQHETVTPNVAVGATPIRLGYYKYVVRCSKRDAKFVDGGIMLICAPN
jgi:hypothetical protein